MKPFKITPLGGIGKIGGNSLLIKSEQHILLIDAGIEFPFEKCLGIDHLVPPFENFEIPEALIITHGHEDHIGAIPYLLSLKPDLPIYAPRFAASLIHRKLSYKKINCKIKIYEAYSPIKIGDIKIVPIPLPHSIPDNYGLAIHQNDHEILFYASDFTINDDEQTQNTLKKLSHLTSKFSNRILFADSTNIECKSSVKNSDLTRDLELILSRASHRILITCFASNIERIKIIAEIGKKLGKKVTSYGRSMNNYIATAIECNILSEDLISDVESFDRSDLIILISGCQGDFKSTLRRIATGDDPKIIPTSSDTFLFSSKVIPGNETQVNYVMDQLSLRGTKIIDSSSYTTHLSGHASQDQLKLLYSSFDPTYVLPVHGNYYHLKLHLAFIKDIYPTAKTKLLTNGAMLTTGKTMSIQDNRDEHKMNLIQNGIILPRSATKERRKIATQGLFILSINKESIGSRKLKYQYECRGLPDLSNEHNTSLTQIIPLSFGKKRGKSLEAIEKELKSTLRIFFKSSICSKPIFIIHFV